MKVSLTLSFWSSFHHFLNTVFTGMCPVFPPRWLSNLRHALGKHSANSAACTVRAVSPWRHTLCFLIGPPPGRTQKQMLTDWMGLFSTHKFCFCGSAFNSLQWDWLDLGISFLLNDDLALSIFRRGWQSKAKQVPLLTGHERSSHIRIRQRHSYLTVITKFTRLSW